MGIILMEGALVTVLVLMGMRERIMDAIPLELKQAIAIGIGLFIAFIGLYDSGLVVQGEGIPVTLARFTTWPVFVTIFGLVFTVALRARGFGGDLLIGIIATTILTTIINWATDYSAFTQPGVARWPEDVVTSPDFGLIGNISFDAFATLGVVATLAWVFSLFLADFFDTMGTLVGVGRQAGYLTKGRTAPGDPQAAARRFRRRDGRRRCVVLLGDDLHRVGSRRRRRRPNRLGRPRVRRALLPVHVPRSADRDGAAAGDRASAHHRGLPDGHGSLGVRGEGRAGTEGTTTRRAIAGIDFNNLALGIAALLTIVIMPLTYSITNGIGFGFIAYVVIRIAQGDWRRVHPLLYAVAGGFLLYFLVPLMQDHLSGSSHHAVGRRLRVAARPLPRPAR
jgi:adenine/guanine/hypoxanthine permease